MKTPAKTSFFNSLRHAIRGCIFLFGTERNAKIHLTVFLLVVAAGYYFELEKTEWMLIVLASGAVVAAEAMNTAVEGIVDLVHPHRGERAGRLKDISAAAVLLVTLAAIVIGVVIFLPRLSALF